MDIFVIGEDERELFMGFYNCYYETFDLNLMATFTLNDINQSFFKVGVIPELDEIQERIKVERKFFESEAARLSNMMDMFYFTVHSILHTRTPLPSRLATNFMPVALDTRLLLLHINRV